MKTSYNSVDEIVFKQNETEEFIELVLKQLDYEIVCLL